MENIKGAELLTPSIAECNRLEKLGRVVLATFNINQLGYTVNPKDAAAELVLQNYYFDWGFNTPITNKPYYQYGNNIGEYICKIFVAEGQKFRTPFRDDPALVKFEIGEGIELDYWAFANEPNPNLIEIVFNNIIPPTYSNGSLGFEYCMNLNKIRIPNGTKDLYTISWT